MCPPAEPLILGGQRAQISASPVGRFIKTDTQLGPYKILSALGKGGMGEVYRAKDSRLGREVAVKVLPDHLSGDASALARFEREAKVLAALSHPNILTIFDVGQDNGVSFVVMELLPGETLRTRIAERRPG